MSKYCACSNCATNFGPPYSLRHRTVETRSVNNPKCLGERRSHRSLLGLEIIKLSKRHVECRDRLKAQPLTAINQVVNIEKKVLREIENATPVNI